MNWLDSLKSIPVCLKKYIQPVNNILAAAIGTSSISLRDASLHFLNNRL
jgi:hypothetical protein